MARVLAIDPGFSRVGTAVIEGPRGEEFLIYSGCLETDKRLIMPERLSQIRIGIEELINRWQPDCLAVEKLFFNTNQKTAMQVAEARGVIIATAEARGLSVHEYTPLEIKVAITGYGQASKAQVADMVKRLIKMSKLPKYDDEYDAIACGLTHLACDSSRR